LPFPHQCRRFAEGADASARRDIVVIGGSAGAIESVSEIVRGLPADFPAAIFLVVHFPGSVTSALPRILNRAGVLRAVHPENEDPIEPGRIYVAPPDCHLFIEDGNVRPSRGPKENGHRPAIDPLFRRAAHHYRTRVIGVLLSGGPALRPALKSCLSGETSFEQIALDAANRRGKRILCQITCAPLVGADGGVAGAIIVMEEVTDGRPSDRAAP
jgi:hypothetical protein